MIEILAVVVGVVLTAVIGLATTQHRNLITYEIVSSYHLVSFEGGTLVPLNEAASDMPVQICAHRMTLVNRGWKNLKDVKIHAEGKFKIAGVKKSASSISKESISVGPRGESLEISIEFMPSKEEITLDILTTALFPDLYKLSGAGSDFKLKSVHYFIGYQNAVAVLKNILALGAIGSLAGSMIGMYLAK